jgi:hypothetical protein
MGGFSTMHIAEMEIKIDPPQEGIPGSPMLRVLQVVASA